MKIIRGPGISISNCQKFKIPVVLATVVLCMGMLGASTTNVAAWTGSGTISPSSAYIGDTVNYQFTLKNTGDTALQVNSATLTIDWGATTTEKAMSGVVALAPSSSGTLTCSFKVPTVAQNTYVVEIEVIGKAVGDWITETKKFTASLAVSPIPPLDVSVTATKTSGQAPLTTTLNAIKEDGVAPYSYYWTFGDGSTSTSQSPSHTYTKGGTYTASCTVEDSKDQTATDSITITVQGNPTDITDSSSGGGGNFGGISPMILIIVIVGVVAAMTVVGFFIMRKK